METKEPIVGRITYTSNIYGGEGDSSEYTNKEEYLAAIKKELFYNVLGFEVDTVAKDPELLKNVDDLLYGECGVDNPNSLEFYYKKLDMEYVEKEVVGVITYRAGEGGEECGSEKFTDKETYLSAIKKELESLTGYRHFSLETLVKDSKLVEDIEKAYADKKARIVGKVSYNNSFNAKTGNYLEFTDKAEFLAVVEKGILYNHEGFRMKIISQDPELAKSIEEIYTLKMTRDAKMKGLPSPQLKQKSSVLKQIETILKKAITKQGATPSKHKSHQKAI